jgi:precorrin-6A synthase
MKRILIIGIGAGNPEYVTIQAVNALNEVDVFFVMEKGIAKEKLIALRKEICRRFIKGTDYRFAEATSPERSRDAANYRASGFCRSKAGWTSKLDCYVLLIK